MNDIGSGANLVFREKISLLISMIIRFQASFQAGVLEISTCTRILSQNLANNFINGLGLKISFFLVIYGGQLR